MNSSEVALPNAKKNALQNAVTNSVDAFQRLLRNFLELSNTLFQGGLQTDFVVNGKGTNSGRRVPSEATVHIGRTLVDNYARLLSVLNPINRDDKAREMDVECFSLTADDGKPEESR